MHGHHIVWTRLFAASFFHHKVLQAALCHHHAFLLGIVGKEIASGFGILFSGASLQIGEIFLHHLLSLIVGHFGLFAGIHCLQSGSKIAYIDFVYARSFKILTHTQA